MKSVNITIQNKSLKPIEVSTHKTLLSSLQEAGLDLPMDVSTVAALPVQQN